MRAYRFAISAVGVGDSADEAFAFVLDAIKTRPASAIDGEIEYAEIEDEEDLGDQLAKFWSLREIEE